MSILAVDQALTSDFIAQAFGLPIAHENSDYKPTAGTPFVRITNFPADVRAVGLADTDVITGAFQFILYYAEGKGALTAKMKAQQIFNAYPIGRIVAYTSEFEVGGPLQDYALSDGGQYVPLAVFDATAGAAYARYETQVRVTGQERPSAFPEDGWYKVRGLIYYEGRVSRAS